MKEPTFLNIEEVLGFHSDQIGRYGGKAGIMDMGLLKSSLAMPEAAFGGEYLHRDIHEMAAAYLFHIVSNHPFMDGNKRTGLITALTFLEFNGVLTIADNRNMENMVLKVAKGKMDKPEIAGFLRKHSSQ